VKGSVFVVMFVLLLLTACDSVSGGVKDLEGVPGVDPDKAETVNNVDGYPNITLLCTHGLAFGTTTREAQAAVFRVPELDVPWCGSTPR